GFYHISVKANVPIVLVKIDYKNKEVGIIHTLKPTGNMEEDFKIIQDQFKDVTGKIPENYNPKIY
ncbi:MAG: acyltransferase, partial [Flavobacteriales bacterium]|nr:acyltransferase [Flavobacteriales bacterium]